MIKYTKLLQRRIKGRMKFYANARFREPLLLLESDDWGMERGHENVTAIESFGSPKEWAYDQPATREQLNNLYEMLGEYRDPLGNPWRMVANFIVQNPDFEKTIQHGYQKLFFKSIGENQSLVQTWKEGLRRGVFYPQYHGRLHYNLQVMEQDLKANTNGARAFFENRFHGSFDNIDGVFIHNHSEYFNCRDSRDYSLEYLKNWIGEGLGIFREIFGFSSESTIAPHYIYTPVTVEAMKTCGIKYIQAADRQSYFDDHQGQILLNLPLGSGHYAGLTALNRNINFEPFRLDPADDLEKQVESARWLFKNNVPVVINTHRINYAGKFFKHGVVQLKRLLDRLRPFRPIVMSSDELGEAINGKGLYRSRLTGEMIQLTPADYRLWRPLRHRLVIREYKTPEELKDVEQPIT